MVAAPVAREIEAAIGAALSRRGVGGTVVLRESMCELHDVSGPRGVVAIDLGEWIDQWQLLPPELQQQRVAVATNRLISALRQSMPPAAVAQPPTWLVPAILAAAVVAIPAGAALYWYASGHGDDDGDAPTTVAPLIAEPDRARQVCEASRGRVYAGADLGMDVSGWVVEYWFASTSQDLSKSPVLTKRLERGALVASAAPEQIAAAPGGVAEVVHERAPYLSLDAAILRLHDGYVAPFMTTDGRRAFVEFAGQLADELDADYAALFARCEHLQVRDIGVWYRGNSDGAALATMVYAAGAFADPIAFDPAKLHDKDVLGELARRSDALDDDAWLALMKRAGVRLKRGDPDAGAAPTELRFRFGGPTRASSVSRELLDLMEDGG